MLQISLQWHGRAVYAPINSTSRGTGPASFDVDFKSVFTLPDLEFVWSWRSLSICMEAHVSKLGSSQSSLSLSCPSFDHGSMSSLSQYTWMFLSRSFKFGLDILRWAPELVAFQVGLQLEGVP